MNCPSDGTTLLMSERQGIEIDYCPQCRGVWLDRGELDKILEKAQAESEQFAAPAPAAPVAPAVPQQAPVAPPQPQYDAPRYDDRRDDRRYDDRRREGSYDDRGYSDRGYGDQRYGSKSGNYRKKKSPFEFLGDIFEG